MIRPCRADGTRPLGAGAKRLGGKCRDVWHTRLHPAKRTAQVIGSNAFPIGPTRPSAPANA